MKPLAEWIMCDRKRRYIRQSAANRAASRMLKQGYPQKESYECPACGYWHIGKGKGS